MQKRIEDFLGKPVVSIQSAAILGTIVNLVIQSGDLKIVACEISVQNTKEKLYLLPNDIRFLNNDKVLINSVQSLTEFDDLVRYQHNILHNYQLTGKQVETVSGKKLGKVVGYVFDADHFIVKKLSVKQGMFKSLIATDLLIDIADIIDTKPKMIVVKDNLIDLKKASPSVLPQRS